MKVRTLHGIIALAVVSAILLAPVVADNTRICHYCGKPIDGPWMEAGGYTYHPEHFLCAHCGEPITDNYIIYDGKNYHSLCYERHIALRCALCGRKIEGEYVLDYWGNAYHAFHEGRDQQCEYCSRFIAPHLTEGGMTYEDGRHICNICLQSAITDETEANVIMREVAGHLASMGIQVETGKLKLHLVDLKELQAATGEAIHSLKGYADYRESSGLFGLVREQDINVYVLTGMPKAHSLLPRAWKSLALSSAVR